MDSLVDVKDFVNGLLFVGDLPFVPDGELRVRINDDHFVIKTKMGLVQDIEVVQ